MNDDKRKKFESLAEKRIFEAVKKISLVGNLSNKNNYNYTEKHAQQLVRALEGAVREVKNKFNSKNKSTKQIFKFNL